MNRSVRNEWASHLPSQRKPSNVICFNDPKKEWWKQIKASERCPITLNGIIPEFIGTVNQTYPDIKDWKKISLDSNDIPQLAKDTYTTGHLPADIELNVWAEKYCKEEKKTFHYLTRFSNKAKRWGFYHVFNNSTGTNNKFQWLNNPAFDKETLHTAAIKLLKELYKSFHELFGWKFAENGYAVMVVTREARPQDCHVDWENLQNESATSLPWVVYIPLTVEGLVLTTYPGVQAFM